MAEEIKESTSEKAKAVALGIEQFNIALIFALFLKQVKGGLELFKLYFLFPLAALADLILAYFAWRDAKKSNYRDAALLHKAGVEIFCSTVVTIAVLLSVLSTAGVISISALIVPIMFSAVMCFKTVDNFIRGCACLIQSKPAAPHFVGAVVAGLITAAVILVLIAGLKAWSLLGIIAGAIGVGFAIYTGCQTCIQRWRRAGGDYQNLHPESPAPFDVVDELNNGSSADLQYPQGRDFSQASATLSEQEAEERLQVLPDNGFTGVPISISVPADPSANQPPLVSGTIPVIRAPRRPVSFAYAGGLDDSTVAELSAQPQQPEV